MRLLGGFTLRAEIPKSQKKGSLQTSCDTKRSQGNCLNEFPKSAGVDTRNAVDDQRFWPMMVEGACYALPPGVDAASPPAALGAGDLDRLSGHYGATYWAGSTDHLQ